MIQPSPGVMLEYEWPRWLPREVLFPVMRVPLRDVSAAGYAEVAKLAPAAATELVRAGCAVIAYACTLGSVFAGAQAEEQMLAAIEAASDRPALSLGKTSVAAFRQLGITRPALLTPYSDVANGWLCAYLAEHGITPAGVIPTPVDIVTVGNLSPQEVAALALAGLAELPHADGLWIPCTAIQTIAAISGIEKKGGRPVVSGSQALLWDALRAIGQSAPIAGAGRLCT